jgi:hypothetical protein
LGQRIHEAASEENISYIQKVFNKFFFFKCYFVKALTGLVGGRDEKQIIDGLVCFQSGGRFFFQANDAVLGWRVRKGRGCAWRNAVVCDTPIRRHLTIPLFSPHQTLTAGWYLVFFIHGFLSSVTSGKVSLYIPSRVDSGNPTHPHCQSTLLCPGRWRWKPGTGGQVALFVLASRALLLASWSAG